MLPSRIKWGTKRKIIGKITNKERTGQPPDSSNKISFNIKKNITIDIYFIIIITFYIYNKTYIINIKNQNLHKIFNKIVIKPIKSFCKVWPLNFQNWE